MTPTVQLQVTAVVLIIWVTIIVHNQKDMIKHKIYTKEQTCIQETSIATMMNWGDYVITSVCKPFKYDPKLPGHIRDQYLDAVVRPRGGTIRGI